MIRLNFMDYLAKYRKIPHQDYLFVNIMGENIESH